MQRTLCKRHRILRRAKDLPTLPEDLPMPPTPSQFHSRPVSSLLPRSQSGQAIASATVPPSPSQIRQPTPRKASLFALPKEPEDARLTGGTRSLDRRLLALNLAGTRRQPAQSTRSAASTPPQPELNPATYSRASAATSSAEKPAPRRINRRRPNPRRLKVRDLPRPRRQSANRPVYSDTSHASASRRWCRPPPPATSRSPCCPISFTFTSSSSILLSTSVRFFIRSSCCILVTTWPVIVMPT